MTAPTVVSVQNTPGPFYTWAGSNFTWTDTRAQKSWNTSYDSTFTVSATEGWTNGDSVGKTTKKPVAEAFHASGADNRQFTKNSPEHLTTGEQLVRVQVRQLAEVLHTTEKYGNGLTKPFSDSFHAAEVGVTRAFTKNPQEVIHTTEQLARSQQFHLYDQFHTADSLGNHLSKAVAEFFHATDDYLKQFGKGIPEAWKTCEHYTDMMAWVLRCVEAVRTSEVLAKMTTLPKVDAFSAAEVGMTRQYGLQPVEHLHAQEVFGKSILHQLQDAINTLESYAQHTTIPVAEQFSTTDFIVKNATMSICEAMHTAELFGRTVEYLRLLNDGFSTHDALAKAMTIPQSEAFHTMEEYRRHGNGVVSNLAIQTDALDDNAFAALIMASSPPGYSDFRTFITGTYTYQKALIRAVVQSFTLDRGVLNDLSITVDVPDVNDSGEAVITNAAAGVAVTYNRKFHVTPEVTLQLKGGADALAVPQFVVSPTNTGFTVKLVDPTTGNAVTGTISWAAHGY